jgi:hypothetical protein
VVRGQIDRTGLRGGVPDADGLAVDICRPGEAAGCYFDNDGSLEVTTSWGSMPDTATLPAPAVPIHDSNWLLLAAVGAVALLTALHLRPRPEGSQRACGACLTDPSAVPPVADAGTPALISVRQWHPPAQDDDGLAAAKVIGAQRIRSTH